MNRKSQTILCLIVLICLLSHLIAWQWNRHDASAIELKQQYEEINRFFERMKPLETEAENFRENGDYYNAGLIRLKLSVYCSLFAETKEMAVIHAQAAKTELRLAKIKQGKTIDTETLFAELIPDFDIESLKTKPENPL